MKEINGTAVFFKHLFFFINSKTLVNICFKINKVFALSSNIITLFVAKTYKSVTRYWDDIFLRFLEILMRNWNKNKNLRILHDQIDFSMFNVVNFTLGFFFFF